MYFLLFYVGFDTLPAMTFLICELLFFFFFFFICVLKVANKKRERGREREWERESNASRRTEENIMKHITHIQKLPEIEAVSDMFCMKPSGSGPGQPALSSSAWAGALEQMTSTGLFQPQPVCNYVILFLPHQLYYQKSVLGNHP